MNKETIILNAINNYGQYGITREVVEPLVDNMRKEGMNYDAIYLMLRMKLCEISREEFYCTSGEVAKAFETTEEEMEKLIQQSRKELESTGENPDDYFKEVKKSGLTIVK